MNDNLSHFSISDLKEMRNRAEEMLAIEEKSIAHLSIDEKPSKKLLHIEHLKKEIKEINEELERRQEISTSSKPSEPELDSAPKSKPISLLQLINLKIILSISIPILLVIILIRFDAFFNSTLGDQEQGNSTSSGEKNQKAPPDKTFPPPIQLYFKLSGGEKTVEKESGLEINGKFKHDSGLIYWICFVDKEYIWPQLRITGSEFSKEVTIPKRFNGGELVLVSVNNKVAERFEDWESIHPLWRSQNEMNTIMAIKINIK